MGDSGTAQPFYLTGYSKNKPRNTKYFTHVREKSWESVLVQIKTFVSNDRHKKQGKTAKSQSSHVQPLPSWILPEFSFFSSEQTDLRCEFTSTAQLSSLKQLRLYFFHLFLPRLSLEAIFFPSLSSLTNLQNFSTTSLIVSVVLSVLPQPSARWFGIWYARWAGS